MGKVLLSVLLVGFLAGCAGISNRGQFAPFPLLPPDSVDAPTEPAAEPEESGGFFGDGFGEGLGGGPDGMFGGDSTGGGMF